MYPHWKRATDVIAGAILLLLALIPLIAIAIAVSLDSGRPIFIRQRRIGAGGVEYLMWKFRSLPTNAPQMSKAQLRTTGIAPTRVGRFLRRYSLDELPQLLNVISGDMALVGPRPALFTQHDLIALRQAAGILEIRPGLTGLAQIRGREDLSLEQKVAQDIEYARRMSPWFDLWIALRTPGAIVRGRGSF